MENLLAKYESPISELVALEYWDNSYYGQEIHDAVDRDAYGHRCRRRAEILLRILEITHPKAAKTNAT